MFGDRSACYYFVMETVTEQKNKNYVFYLKIPAVLSPPDYQRITKLSFDFHDSQQSPS